MPFILEELKVLYKWLSKLYNNIHPLIPLEVENWLQLARFPFWFPMFHDYFSRPLLLFLCFLLIVNLIAWEKKAALFSRTAVWIQSILGVKKEKENFHVTPTQKCQFCFPKGEKIQKTPHEENIECFICCEIKPFFNVFWRLKLTQL